MKRVGVVIRENHLNNKIYYAIKKDVIDYLNKKVIIVPIILNNKNNVMELVKLCDGIILTGGNILCKLDYELVKYLYKNNIPTLGICLGMQIMSNYYNGKIDHLKNNDHNSNKRYVHDVLIKKDSILYTILQKNILKVNSRHHDYIIKTKLDVSALSTDNIIEGVEDKTKKFFIGVQWHPESLNNKDSDKLINYFIKML